MFYLGIIATKSFFLGKFQKSVFLKKMIFFENDYIHFLQENLFLGALCIK